MLVAVLVELLLGVLLALVDDVEDVVGVVEVVDDELAVYAGQATDANTVPLPG